MNEARSLQQELASARERLGKAQADADALRNTLAKTKVGKPKQGVIVLLDRMHACSQSCLHFFSFP